MSSAELSGWITYLQLSEKIQADWISLAIVKAFNGEKQGPKPKDKPGFFDGEEIIDTTTADFREHFKGFTGQSGQPLQLHGLSRDTHKVLTR